MNMNQIKINRALRLADVGRFPGSAWAMLDHVPASVVAALTARQLAAMLDGLWDACREAKGIATSEACADGVVWDVKRQALREIGA
jgi:hypothetical protein